MVEFIYVCWQEHNYMIDCALSALTEEDEVLCHYTNDMDVCSFFLFFFLYFMSEMTKDT